MDSARAVLGQPLFWIVVTQVTLFPSLVRISQHYIVPRSGGLLEPVLEVIVMACVAFATFLGPFYLAGYLPLPRGEGPREAWFWGFVIGAVMSFPLQGYVLRRLKGRGR